MYEFRIPDKQFKQFKQFEITVHKPEVLLRQDERRKLPSMGFTRISMVGWICRREVLRRKGDHGFSKAA